MQNLTGLTYKEKKGPWKLCLGRSWSASDSFPNAEEGQELQCEISLVILWFFQSYQMREISMHP